MKLRNIALAFQFLTIIPIKTTGEVSEKDIADSSIFFPVVGAFQGFILVALSFFLLKVFSPEITTALVLVAYLLTNGGFHQDGLSDTFDAISVKSTGNRAQDIQKRLAVMKDSTTGPIGVIAIVFSLLLKYLLIKAILQIEGNACFILFLMPIYSKWAMVSVMYRSRSARSDGIGRIFLERVGFKHALLSTLLIFFTGLTAFYACGYGTSSLAQLGEYRFILFLFCEIAVIFLFCLFLRHIFTNKFGGLTGDNFGAIHEISEIVFLLVALIWR
ncbi:MAG: adenosylcobinamide-GDP ribazoletransferase [Proteobacteria bacterium]|nr:adenosylcobinamide-GDP ribazoletransferase [Pseudomonadota bacterium]